MCSGHNVECLTFLTYFNKTWNLTNVHKVPSIKLHINSSTGRCSDTWGQGGRAGRQAGTGGLRARYHFSCGQCPYGDLTLGTALPLYRTGISLLSTERFLYTGCNRRNVQDFGRVFLRSNYTDITQNTYIQSSMVTEILAREKCGLLWCLRTVLCS